MAKKKQVSGLYLPSDPVYRLPSEVIDSTYLVDRAMKFAEHARNDRMQWYQNRKNWLSLLDDYSSSIRKGAKNEVSNFHLPVIEPQIDAMRAQLLASIFFTGTPFHVSAGEDMDEVRVKKITNFMRYIVTRCANNGRGIYDAFYDFTTYLAMDGVGLLSRDWKIEYYSYIDIDRNEEFIGLSKLLSQAKMTDMTEEEFLSNADKIASFPYKEVKKIGVNDYPLIRALPVDNVLFKGHSYEAMDLNSHDTVIEVTWFTKDQLLQMKSMGVFDEDVVDKIIAGSTDRYGSTNHSSRSSDREAFIDQRTGITTLNSQTELAENKFEFYRVFDKVSLDSKNRFGGVPSNLVYYVHGESQQLAGWNYLDRVTASKKRPLHMAHLYRRPGRTMGFGLAEKLNQVSSLTDLMVNHMIEAGLLANTPMFAWRADSNAFDPAEMRVEPGLGIKTEDPHADIRFLNFNSNPTWAMGVIQYMMGTVVPQQSAIGAERFGQVASRVGATRSNSGLQTLLSQSDQLLNVILKFCVAPCLSEFFTALYADASDHFSSEEQLIPILGMDGVQIKDKEGKSISDKVKREDLSKNYHFVFNVTAANMNKEQKKAEALEWFQFISQPIFMKTGVFGASQALSLATYMSEVYEMPNSSRFINEKISDGVVLPYETELQMIRQLLMPPIGMSDPEHQKKIDYLEVLLSSPELQSDIDNKLISPDVTRLIEVVIAKHQEMLSVQESAQAMQNPTGTNNAITQQNTLGANTGNQNPDMNSMFENTATPSGGAEQAQMPMGEAGGNA